MTLLFLICGSLLPSREPATARRLAPRAAAPRSNLPPEQRHRIASISRKSTEPAERHFCPRPEPQIV